ncbi:MAG TPA: UV DNA damage repair endonuclease UvsE [Pirellulales bacterium]|jgi:UV DNA damage endonuclease|nr:UV DNA damage repair endonuclease UvsE [Pirellulales bacterium]
MIRLGLCCLFHAEPIKFRTTTAAALAKLARPRQLERLSQLCAANAAALLAALRFCSAHGIGCFRINSRILPLKTHPALGYPLEELPQAGEILRAFQECGAFARAHALRTCFHPDQFVVLNSQRPEVVASSVRELEYQAEVAEWVQADVINIHGGGAFGNKPQALADFCRGVERLSPRARSRLTVENDDTLFSARDLAPVCRELAIPLVYDVHHHRCLRDAWSVEEATAAALATWNREPLFHVSSPRDGWAGPRPQRHHDYIDPSDLPGAWRDLDLTVEVEAKAKELAVLRLKEHLASRRAAAGSQAKPARLAKPTLVKPTRVKPTRVKRTRQSD